MWTKFGEKILNQSESWRPLASSYFDKQGSSASGNQTNTAHSTHTEIDGVIILDPRQISAHKVHHIQIQLSPPFLEL